MGASLESSEQTAPLGRAAEPYRHHEPCVARTALMKRTVLITRCSSEGPLARVRYLSTKPSRPFCLKEKRKQLVPPPKIILSDAAG